MTSTSLAPTVPGRVVGAGYAADSLTGSTDLSTETTHLIVMATDISNRVREIARHRDSDESSIIEQALERGLDDLWEDVVVARYLDGELSREEAVAEVGPEPVERADAASDAVDADIEWAFDEDSA